MGLFDPKAGAHGLGESGGDQGCAVLSRSEDTQDLQLGLVPLSHGNEFQLQNT